MDPELPESVARQSEDGGLLAWGASCAAVTTPASCAIVLEVEFGVERINFNHLRCFWAAAREGSISAAGKKLGLTQPTISKQIGELEDAFDQALFRRVGRRLVLTDVGRLVYTYADDIFALGQELLGAVHGRAPGRPIRLHIGVSDVVPKLLTRLVLEPALQTNQEIRLLCSEGKTEQLLADLALGGLDAVLTDAPLPPGTSIKVFNHKLGESDVDVFGSRDLVHRYRRGFPRSLNGAPLLLPTAGTALRRSIDGWLEQQGTEPRIVAEFQDSALLKSFAKAGHGLFFAPAAVERSIREQYDIRLVGRTNAVSEQLFMVTVERRITNPGVSAIVEAARDALRGG